MRKAVETKRKNKAIKGTASVQTGLHTTDVITADSHRPLYVRICPTAKPGKSVRTAAEVGQKKTKKQNLAESNKISKEASYALVAQQVNVLADSERWSPRMRNGHPQSSDSKRASDFYLHSSNTVKSVST